MAMPEWIKKELRANYARASLLELTNGAAITIPVTLIPGLKRAAPSDVRSVELLGRDGGLHWESLDLDLSAKTRSRIVDGGEEPPDAGPERRRRSAERSSDVQNRFGRICATDSDL